MSIFNTSVFLSYFNASIKGLATNINQRGCPIQQVQNLEDDAELLKKKAEKSAQRRKLEMEKREESKKKTMDRLLKKKDSKVVSLLFVVNLDT